MNVAMTNYLEEKLLEHTLLNLPWTSPDTVYLGLFTADPGEAAETTNEVDAAEYTREQIDFSNVNVGTGEDDSSFVLNTDDIEFPQAQSEWGKITHVMIFDSVTDGNGLFYGEVEIAKTITEDDFIRFPANELEISLN